MTQPRIDLIVLGKLHARPQWLKSLSRVRPVWKRLEAAGLARRIKPPTGTARNMLEITPAGIDAIEAHWAAEQARQGPAA